MEEKTDLVSKLLDFCCLSRTLQQEFLHQAFSANSNKNVFPLLKYFENQSDLWKVVFENPPTIETFIQYFDTQLDPVNSAKLLLKLDNFPEEIVLKICSASFESLDLLFDKIEKNNLVKLKDTLSNVLLKGQPNVFIKFVRAVFVDFESQDYLSFVLSFRNDLLIRLHQFIFVLKDPIQKPFSPEEFAQINDFLSIFAEFELFNQRISSLCRTIDQLLQVQTLVKKIENTGFVIFRSLISKFVTSDISLS